MLELDFREFFEYLRNEFDSVKSLITEYEYKRDNYAKQKTRLQNKKDDIFASGNISRWDLTTEEFESIDKENLKKNKEFAFKYILKKVICI